MSKNYFAEAVAGEFAGSGKIYENVPAGEKKLTVDTAVVTENGVYMVIMKRAEWRLDVKELSTFFQLGKAGYFFLYDDAADTVEFYDGSDLVLLESEKELESMELIKNAVDAGIYTLGARARHTYDLTLEEILSGCTVENAGGERKPVFSEYMLDMINEVFEKQLTDDSPVRVAGRMEKTVDGVTYVRRVSALGREEWCMVDESIDPDAHASLAALLGFAGVHRFAEGRIGSGLLYILTFGGCFNILPLFDVLAMLTGSYRLKNGDYIGRVKNVKAVLLKLIATVAIGVALFVAMRFVLTKGTFFVADKVTDSIESDTEGMTDDELYDYYSDLLGKFGITSDELDEYIDDLEEAETEEELDEIFEEIESGDGDAETGTEETDGEVPESDDGFTQ